MIFGDHMDAIRRADGDQDDRHNVEIALISTLSHPISPTAHTAAMMTGKQRV